MWVPDVFSVKPLVNLKPGVLNSVLLAVVLRSVFHVGFPYSVNMLTFVNEVTGAVMRRGRLGGEGMGVALAVGLHIGVGVNMRSG